MKIPVQSFLCALFILTLYACRSADDFQSGESASMDPDPSLYFSRQTGPSRRAAVLNFTSGDGGSAFFDAFVTDEVIRRLSAAKNLVLVERSRIDLVIQEHELAQSGLVSRDDALRLGALLTVDYLVTGTYIYKDETIFVRGRVLEGKTGKMESAFAFKIPYKGRKTKSPAGDDIKTDQGCEKVQRPVLLALRDLSTPPAVERAADRAIAVPWKKPCGRIHMKVTADFAHAGLYPNRYHEFLAKTLEKMEVPRDEYYTVKEIFYYFSRDGVISEFEWSAAREILKRGWHPFYLKYLFSPDRYNDVVMRRRAAELLALAREGEIGRPFALSEYRIGDDLLTTPFVRNSEKGIAFSLFILRSLRNPAGAPSKNAQLFFRIITDCYEETLTPEYRKESLEMLIGFLKARPPDEEFAYMLWLFLRTVDEKIREKRRPYIPHLPYDPTDLRKINTELHEYLCLQQGTVAGSYSEKEFGDYMRRYGVSCAAER